MKKELDEKLCVKYPKIFVDRHADMRTTAMCWGFEHGNGWYWLIDQLCSNLQWNTDHNNKDHVIKNKFLRKFIPILLNVLEKIPGKYHFAEKKKPDLLAIFRSYLIGKVSKWRSSLEWIDIESNKYPQIVATQVKEKFGGLRFYVVGASDKQWTMIELTENLSYHICETCGSTKDVGQTQGWIYTLCKECVDKEPDKYKTWIKNEDRTKETDCEF